MKLGHTIFFKRRDYEMMLLMKWAVLAKSTNIGEKDKEVSAGIINFGILAAEYVRQKPSQREESNGYS